MWESSAISGFIGDTRNFKLDTVGFDAHNTTRFDTGPVRHALTYGGDAFREAMETAIFPRLREFKPDILIISAGFDAHTRDPLANLNLVEADYSWVTKKLMEIADASANGRIVSMLEGGYDLQGLARSTAAHVTALMRG